MRRIELENLEIIDWYDGPKMAADFSSFSLYVWNDFDEEGQWDSRWLCLDLSRSPDCYIGFFQGRNSLKDLIERALKIKALGYGRLSSDFARLEFWPRYSFDIEMPGADSYLGTAEADYAPVITKIRLGDGLSLREVNYGGHGKSFDFVSQVKEFGHPLFIKREFVHFLKTRRKMLFGDNPLFYACSEFPANSESIRFCRVADELEISQKDVTLRLPLEQARRISDGFVESMPDKQTAGSAYPKYKASMVMPASPPLLVCGSQYVVRLARTEGANPTPAHAGAASHKILSDLLSGKHPDVKLLRQSEPNGIARWDSMVVVCPARAMHTGFYQHDGRINYGADSPSRSALKSILADRPRPAFNILKGNNLWSGIQNRGEICQKAA